MIRQLLYASRGTYTLQADDLIRLLLSARAHNRRARVTGVLVYRNGAFMQLLEGGEQALSGLYARIADDPRHCDIEMMLSRAVDTPLMHGWSMGYAEAPTAEGRDAFAGLRSDARVLAQLEQAPRDDAVVRLLLDFLRSHPVAPSRDWAGRAGGSLGRCMTRRSATTRATCGTRIRLCAELPPQRNVAAPHCACITG